MNATIERAIQLFGGEETDWRMTGKAAVHKDIAPDEKCRFLGPAILRGGVFHDGVFRGGEFRGGVFRGGVFRGGWFRGGWFRGGVFRGGVFHDGEFCGGEWARSPVFVQGTRYFVCESDNNHISSGCIRKPVEWWKENLVRCAEEHSYTPEQVEEYKLIFDFVITRMEKTQPCQTA